MRIQVLTDDLLFGSRLQAELSAAGHSVAIVATADAEQADLLVADLTADAPARLAALASLPSRPPTLAFYSHVETDVRDQADAAGIELTVPRSRINREAAALVERLAATAP